MRIKNKEMVYLSVKAYLLNQIRLLTFSTYDLFTDKEIEIYQSIIELIQQIDQLEHKEKNNLIADVKAYKKVLIEQKRQKQKELSEEIKKHAGTPRIINLNTVLDYKKKAEDQKGITWWTLKVSRKIAEFSSEESRAMGLKHLDITFDKIIIKWKSLDVLEQIVLDGFILPILNEDDTVEYRHYRFMTASAGQLRTDKTQFISDCMWDKIKGQMQCGMDWNTINEHGGINIGKYLAYTSLPSSATEESNINIDSCIVVNDFEAPVTGRMNYITQDYKIEKDIRTVIINHCDGAGMCLPGVLDCGNAMVRGPYLKGLLSEFDFIEWCKEHNAAPEIKDVWGNLHNLIDEDIKIIFTASQLKLWKYYDDWNHYKKCFKDNNCHICLTNYEEKYIKDTYLNYQMIQDLDMTDDEIYKFTIDAFNRINGIATSEESMLQTLGADEQSDKPYQQSLYIYHELLRDGYSRETLKAIKKKNTYNAKSGTIKCKNKRLFAIPDLYAACEFWFLHIEQPNGLLKDGEVYSKLYNNEDEGDVLRSPHLSFEHAIRKFNHSEECKRWFKTKGIYTSCKDLISRILQFDVDGDQLNIVTEKTIINAAKRRMIEFDFAPLFYDANKAKPMNLSKGAIFYGLKLAHEYSGIGVFSNMITKLWNKDNPDQEAAALICMTNNYSIDAAKTGFLNSYEDHPEAKKKVSKAVGGKSGKMPHFFQFSKNGRHNPNGRKIKRKDCLAPNKSTMNRICNIFNGIGNINFNYANIPPFNYQMLLSKPSKLTNKKAIELFCELDNQNISNIIEASTKTDQEERMNTSKYDIVAEQIKHELIERYGSLEKVYPVIVKYLFVGENFNKQNHKQMFWRVFGDIAIDNLIQNSLAFYTCEKCNCKIPIWATTHECSKHQKGMFECCDCGKLCNRINPKQKRCPECQEIFKEISNKARWAKFYSKHKDNGKEDA